MRFIFLLFLQGLITIAYACDYCGGSSLGMESGLLSDQSGNAIGLQTSMRNYKMLGEGATENNFLLNWTVSGSYTPCERAQLKVLVPVYLQVHRAGQQRQAGLGDILLLLNITAIDRVPEDRQVNRHHWLFTTGLEWPTGKYSSESIEGSAVLPMGSRSWDVLIGTNYSFRSNEFTISTGVIAKINTFNRDKNRFGSGIETTALGGYAISAGDGILQPMIGYKYNWQARDVQNGFIRKYSGGSVLWQIAGLQFNYYKYRLAYQLEVPLVQRIKNNEVKNGVYNALKFTYQF